jgi:flagellar biosynthesis activator protein FlaF
MSQQKVNAYSNQQQQTEMDGREIDKRALLNCAARLKSALDDGGKDMKLYQAALRHNQHLWTIFQVALTDPSNALPRDLKMTLLRLSSYVDRVSFRAISEFMPQILNSLIDIDRALAAGLAKQQQTGSAAPVQNVVPAPTLPGTSSSIITSA